MNTNLRQAFSSSNVAAANWLKKLPTWQLVIVALIAIEALPAPVGWLLGWLRPYDKVGGLDVKAMGIVVALIVTCIIGPPIETAINQWACINFLRRRLHLGALSALVLSSLIFAGLHGYSVTYFFTIFPVGMVLGSVFLLEQSKGGSPFWVVTIVHSIKNAIAISLIFYAP